MKIDVYSDGSGNTFDSDGGWGFRVLIDGKVLLDGSGYLPAATNNVAELRAAIEGLKAAKKHIADTKPVTTEVTLISDSQLVLGYANGRYKCKAIHLAKLYIEVKGLFNELNTTAKWVKGHSGDEHNEACDVLAKVGRESKGK